MRVRILVIAGTIFLSLGLVGMALALAQSAAPGQARPDAESSREAELAAAAEQSPVLAPRGSVQITAPLVISAPLFVGVDRVAQFTHLIDPETGESHSLFDGYEVWGAAYAPDTRRLFFVTGPTLYQWSLLDGVLERLGTIENSKGTAALSMVGLAYGDGTLYGVRNITTADDPKGLYAIDPDTLIAANVAPFGPNPDLIDLSGLDYNHENGKLYATNNNFMAPGLVELGLNGVITPVAPYPAGKNHLDGLAIGDGRAYLIPDAPGFIYVYDFATTSYTTPITNPWTTEAVFAGGAWISGPGPTYLPVVAGSPLLEP